MWARQTAAACILFDSKIGVVFGHYFKLEQGGLLGEGVFEFWARSFELSTLPAAFKG